VEFVNETKVAAGWTMGFERDGRELVVVAMKATFAFPRNGGDPQLAEEQIPLVNADQFTGTPGLSAPLYESDYAHRKPMCDVLVNGTAYAPPGKVVRQTGVSVRVGSMVKAFNVVGPRVWRKAIVGFRPSEPEPFDVMPISYNNAFGGVEESHSEVGKVHTFLPNPAGRGYSHSKQRLDGMPLPNTEENGKAVTDPGGEYRPMALGPVGRNWPPRVSHAGTYDQRWLDDRAPFWPDDFNYRYFQAAPIDQQIGYPAGGEEVILKNMTPSGAVGFFLPRMSMPVWFVPYRGRDVRVDGQLDTVLIEADKELLMLTWRAALPMRRSCFDVKQIIVGEMSEARQRARKYRNKPYYRGLAELVRARRGEKR
jgi:hypothetical protein